MNYQQNFSYSTNSPFNYVKKEDAKQLLSKGRFMGIFFAAFLAIMFAVFELVVFPKLQETSSTIPQFSMPFYASPNFRYSVYAVILGLLIFIQPEPPEELDRKLARYKEGEMILVSKLVDKGYNTKIGIIFLFAIVYFVLAMVLPISMLTESV